MIAKFVKKESIEEVVIGNVIIMLLLYADVLLFAKTLGNALKFKRALFFFPCILSVNNSKTKIMLVKSQKKEKPHIIYNNEPFEIVVSFK